jgi:hypothetical protein
LRPLFVQHLDLHKIKAILPIFPWIIMLTTTYYLGVFFFFFGSFCSVLCCSDSGEHSIRDKTLHYDMSYSFWWPTRNLGLKLAKKKSKTWNIFSNFGFFPKKSHWICNINFFKSVRFCTQKGCYHLKVSYLALTKKSFLNLLWWESSFYCKFLLNICKIWFMGGIWLSMKGYFVCLGCFILKLWLWRFVFPIMRFESTCEEKKVVDFKVYWFFFFVLNLDSCGCRWVNFVIQKIYLAYCVIVILDFF